jgi:hypothetical protein
MYFLYYLKEFSMKILSRALSLGFLFLFSSQRALSKFTVTGPLFAHASSYSVAIRNAQGQPIQHFGYHYFKPSLVKEERVHVVNLPGGRYTFTARIRYPLASNGAGSSTAISAPVALDCKGTLDVQEGETLNLMCADGTIKRAHFARKA